MSGFIGVTQPKLRNIQGMRGIAVLLVVLFHLAIIEKKYGHSYTLLPGFLSVGSSGVDIFFVISGFIMATITQGKFSDIRAPIDFLLQRFTRIYPLYWFYSLVVLAVFWLHPEWVNQSQNHQFDIIQSFLLFPQNKLPLLLVGWTLIYEIYFYFIVALLLFFPEQKFIHLLIMWSLIIIIGSLFKSSNPYILVYTNPMGLEFIAGCIIARLFHRHKTNYNVFFVTLSLFFVLTVFAFFFSVKGKLPDAWVRVCFFGAPATLLILFATYLEFKNIIFPSWLRAIGDASYSIYLSHVLVLSAVGRLWSMLPENYFIEHFFVLIFLMAFVTGIGRLSYLYIEQPLIAYFRKFTIKRKIYV